MKIDFGSGYNPKPGYLSCDFVYNRNIDLYFIDGKFDLPNNSVDEIFCKNVLHHIKNLDNLYKEFARVLKINGKLSILDCNKDSFKVNYLLDRIWYRHVNNKPEIWFSETYRDLKPKVGFKVISEYNKDNNIFINLKKEN